MTRPWKPGRIWYRPKRRLDFAELPSLLGGGDYRAVAIWQGGSRVCRLHIAKRPAPGATTRERHRWESLERFEVSADVFEDYARVLQLVPILDDRGFIHMCWARGSDRGLSASRYEELWRIRYRVGRW